MARRAMTSVVSSGICSFCQDEIDKRKMTQHLKHCKQEQALLRRKKHLPHQKSGFSICLSRVIITHNTGCISKYLTLKSWKHWIIFFDLSGWNVATISALSGSM